MKPISKANSINQYMVRPNKDGLYYLGPNREFILDNTALKHIIYGDIQFSGSNALIKGGMHTCIGWIDFKNNRNDLVHGRFYNADANEKWYFARELQNGVILLKLPADVFTKKGAKMTEYPDRYYKSGYLWKTLFPQDSTNDSIISLINEALHNKDKEESNQNLIVGYSNVFDPFKAIKIRIQLRENKIISAFPT